MKRWPAAVTAALIACGCSGRGSLESELRQLRSLDAEAALMDEVIYVRSVTHKFARGHARYLQQAAHESVQKLAHARPEPGDSTALARAQANAEHLEQRFVALMLRVQ
jgi:hypothetical protein